MAIKYIPYFPNTLEGQALLDNFVRTKRVLRYRDNDKVVERIERGMPLYEMELKEKVGDKPNENLIIRGECVSACAYLKDKGITVDLVYIDPPFASGADYAKKVYVRRNPKVAETIRQAETELDIEELKAFEEKMYGDVWDKERYLNWMYENLMAIKSVMSDTASIYVHLDWHIGHYVKILLDEIFGEDNFRNEIIWCYYGPGSPGMKQFNRKHDTIFWYSKSDEYNFFDQQIRTSHNAKTLENFKKGLEGSGFISDNYDLDIKGKIPDDWWEMAVAGRFPIDGMKRVDYSTEKPWELIERIINASSKEGMIVADFFGGSGVAAAVAHKLNRKFIHNDIGINSIQTVRDRLLSANAEFDMLEIKDGVSLYRNPAQTDDKLKTLIIGLRNENLLSDFWAGCIIDTKFGMMPVYLPKLKDGSGSRQLDIPLMNRIIREAMPDLPDDTKRVIVYYIDIVNREEIDQFIKENGNPLVEIELRDLKQVLDNVVIEDYAEWNVSETQINLFKGWKVEITQFHSDRVIKKIEEINLKGQQQVLQQKAKGKDKDFNPIVISDEGLETIEWISLDCTHAEKNAPWHSDCEIKIDKLGYVIKDGIKTNDFWDACIYSEEKPLRMKIRNICGDETVYML